MGDARMQAFESNANGRDGFFFLSPDVSGLIPLVSVIPHNLEIFIEILESLRKEEPTDLKVPNTKVQGGYTLPTT